MTITCEVKSVSKVAQHFHCHDRDHYHDHTVTVTIIMTHTCEVKSHYL